MTNIRQFSPDDFSQIRHLVDSSESLDKHTNYTYWIAQYHSPKLFLVYEVDGVIAGFVFGIISQTLKKTAFLWQIGVSSDFRRQGIAQKLLDEFYVRSLELEIGTIQLTITPDNKASNTLFTRFAESKNCELVAIGETGNLSKMMENEIIYEMSIKSSRQV